MKYRKYESEIELFKKSFSKYKDKRIILYGLGRHTSTLLNEVKDYNFVGLLDRDKENIGKLYFGLPVISIEEAENRADLIIINTPEAYWQTIYRRIEWVPIPVYFRDGSFAYKITHEEEDLEYWDANYSDLKKKCLDFEVVSFDIFDTLLMRKVLLPVNVYQLIGIISNEPGYLELRRKISGELGDIYTIFELYDAIQQETGWTNERINELLELEYKLEKNVTIPRKQMVKLLNELHQVGKEIYVISDMYFPHSFILDLLEQCGMTISKSRVLISSELKKSKSNGELWEFYANDIVKGRKAIHIGDNTEADIINPKKYNIHTYKIMSAYDMCLHSSIKKLCFKSESVYDDLVMGLVCSKVFNDPFSICATRGIIKFDDFEILGYCWFGSVILTFLLWLLEETQKESVEQIIFFLRDGYFLQKDYQYIKEKLNETNIPLSISLPISRRLISIASIVDEEGFREAACFPYVGTWEAYMKDRFDILIEEGDVHKNEIINSSEDFDKIKKWIVRYRKQLIEEINNEKESYRKYISALNIKENAIVVDTGFLGNTQRMFNIFLNKQMLGYYFTAELSTRNNNFFNNNMKACFQDVKDVHAENCFIHKQEMVLESFLTAPYGMIRRIDNVGKWITDEKKQCQKTFAEREKINLGVQEFINDFISIAPKWLGRGVIDACFVDQLFGLWIEGGSILAENIKDIFYWDNGIVHKREMKIFE